MASALDINQAKSRVTLTGTQATLLITLYGRYLDAISDDPILGDQFAGQVLEKIDHDFATIGVAKGTMYMVGTRGKWMDSRIAQFLSQTPEPTVVHLGCGLDTHVPTDWNGDQGSAGLISTSQMSLT